jgi:hypothetical protein
LPGGRRRVCGGCCTGGAGLQQAVVDELVEVVGGQGPADAGGVGGLVAADGDAAFGHVPVEGAADGVTQAGQAGELLIDVGRVHKPF